MKYKKLLLLIFFISINLSLIFAQNKYKNGFIIEDKDTSFCYIQRTPLKEVHHGVYIKTNLSDTSEYFYKPTDVDGMYMDGFGEFVGRNVTVRMAKNIIMSSDYNAKDEEQTVNQELFLRIIAGGRVNLYHYIDRNMKDHFFIEKDTFFYELFEKKQYIYKKNPADSRDMNRYLSVQKKYLGKLKFLLSDCNRVKEKVNKTQLTESSLLKLVNEYNSCFNNVKILNFNKDFPVKEISKIKSLIIHPSFFVGLGESRFHFRGLILNDVRKLDEPFNSTFTGGAQINMVFPKFSYDFGVTLGLLHAKNNFVSNYDTIKYDATYLYKSYFKVSYSKFSILLKYSFNDLKIKPYIFGGVFFNKASILNTGVSITINDGFSETTENVSFFDIYANSVTIRAPRYRNDESGLSFGFGLKKPLGKRSSFFVESRYDRGNGYITSNHQSMISYYINMVAGFEF